jgi:hypothetical protein
MSSSKQLQRLNSLSVDGFEPTLATHGLLQATRKRLNQRIHQMLFILPLECFYDQLRNHAPSANVKHLRGLFHVNLKSFLFRTFLNLFLKFIRPPTYNGGFSALHRNGRDISHKSEIVAICVIDAKLKDFSPCRSQLFNKCHSLFSFDILHFSEPLKDLFTQRNKQFFLTSRVVAHSIQNRLPQQYALRRRAFYRTAF